MTTKTVKVRVIVDNAHDTTLNKEYNLLSYSDDGRGGCWIIDDVGDEYCLYEYEFEIVEGTEEGSIGSPLVLALALQRALSVAMREYALDKSEIELIKAHIRQLQA